VRETKSKEVARRLSFEPVVKMFLHRPFEVETWNIFPSYLKDRGFYS
jgi:hypothetical protein